VTKSDGARANALLAEKFRLTRRRFKGKFTGGCPSERGRGKRCKRRKRPRHVVRVGGLGKEITR